MTRTSNSPRTPQEAALPQFCDYSCQHAEFARPDAVGACRRNQGVYCKKFRKYNTKNAKCLGRT